MKRHAWTYVLLTLFAAAGGLAQSASLEVYSLDPAALMRVSSSLRSPASPFVSAYKKLIRDADKALTVEPVSVTEKEAVPPSGDKRDYMSLSRYWWPDPAKPDGLPYIRRDGETNPEISAFPDHERFVTMVSAVAPLGLAYLLTGEESYARHAAKLVRTWFLDSAKGMNPNLQFSQAVPGRSEGRGPGVLDGRHTAVVIDAVGMIRGSKAWTALDDAALRAWFAQYVTWLTESANGKDERDAPNNHGTWYDAHLLPAAMYAGKTELAQRIVTEVAQKRVLAQIEPDGSQPKELARTRPFHYSMFNLEAHLRLALQARRLGVELWSDGTPEGRRLRAAVDFLLPYALGEQAWPYADLDGVTPTTMALVLLRAYAVTQEPRYLDAAARLGDMKLNTHRDLLLYGVAPVRPD